MGTKNCMNEVCRGTTTSTEWKKGWTLKSGALATLCSNCGSAYENFVFCETFHSDESGWRECKLCRKLVHCGCIASKSLYEYMDFGGVVCQSCSKHLENRPVPTIQIPSDILNGTFVTNGIRDICHIPVESRINDDNKFKTERLLQLTNAIRVNDVASALEQHKRNDLMPKGPKPVESSHRVPNLSQQFSPPPLAKTDNSQSKQGFKDVFETHVPPPLNFSLTTPLGSPSTAKPFPGGIVERSDQSKGSFQQGQKIRNSYPKPPKPSPTAGSETNKGLASQIRVARPPAEGRGRNQLLPRYWPRITDQELQQLSGDLKSNIVPLFEKILSASDAGRIGRLVLPKACAEAYFPAINQSEGIPIKIQDIKGKEWSFQFRFWPNNNSRMYVLEGVTPCIQNMQVQAGDTVIFSRREPGGQLVIGCRKASLADGQDASATTVPAGDSRDGKLSGATDNQLANGGKASDDSMPKRVPASEKKKAKNMKNQRLHMHNDEAKELRITWEEAQELFRPSPSAKPTVVMVEGHEFEEFDEPPVFGKRPILISRSSGEPEQLAQCDKCMKWRSVPVHVLLPTTWACSDNAWDSKRCSCSAPEDINPRDLELSTINHDSKKRRISHSKPSVEEGESSGLDALATAAVLGDNLPDFTESSVGATTRHPRHRPGCTCIVCIQPPSGKGKHEPTCKCNVCLTVKRRFKTLMMRKKKRQSEREAAAELAQEKESSSSIVPKIEHDKEDIAGNALLNMSNPEKETNSTRNQMDLDQMTNKEQEQQQQQDLDLNCDPRREDNALAVAAGMSLTALVNAATLPSDMYAEQIETPKNVENTNVEAQPVPQTSTEGEEKKASDQGEERAGTVTSGHVE